MPQPPSWLAKGLHFMPGQEKITPFKGSIDAPIEGELVYQHGFDCRGWLHRGDAAICTIEISMGGTPLGSTEIFYARPDVARAHHRVDMSQVGYTVRCIIPEELRERERVELQFDLVGPAPSLRRPFGKRLVRLSKIDYRRHGHGTILTDGASEFLKREQVYGSGPPSPDADPLCVELVTRYLHPRTSVLDVGCGIGAWCGPLTSYGVEWTGCETRSDFVDQMRTAGLRAVHIDGSRLPFDDGEFEQTISIEVLEHISDHESFLSEVARVSKKGSLFSVPNFAAVPVTASVYALPWHMLEADHKNFFTVRSLGELLKKYYAHVETFEYGPLANLRSSEGLQIMNHIFAVAFH